MKSRTVSGKCPIWGTFPLIGKAPDNEIWDNRLSD